MKKEDWINDILNAADKISEVEVNPYLFNKIENRINSGSTESAVKFKTRLAWAMILLLVCGINISALFVYSSKVHKQNESTAIEDLSKEFCSNTIYNF